jgi:hypothetical protein
MFFIRMPSIELFECGLKLGGHDRRQGAVLRFEPDHANSSNARESIAVRVRISFPKTVLFGTPETHSGSHTRSMVYRQAEVMVFRTSPSG